MSAPERRAPRSRASVVLMMVALVVALAVPSVLHAATVLTISPSRTSGYPDQVFKLTGVAGSAAAGKTVYVQYRKSGPALWRSVKRTLNSKGVCTYNFIPSSSGTYYYRLKYGSRTTTSRSLTVKAPTKVTLASTTSTTDSGLFFSLIPAFERAYPMYYVDVLSLGSGPAIKSGKDGNSDVLLVHDPAAEIEFMNGSYGVAGSRHSVMANHFVIVGPKSDPAKVKGSKTLTEALNKIRNASHPAVQWVARSDGSGTNTKNDDIWKAADGIPTDDWYIKIKDGMGAALTMADQKSAYTLSDDSTFLYRGPDGLELLYKQQTADKGALNNPYSVMEVKNARHPAGAAAFSKYIRSTAGQAVIRRWGVARFGFSLFTPMAGQY